jgi:hypothetical protein
MLENEYKMSFYRNYFYSELPIKTSAGEMNYALTVFLFYEQSVIVITLLNELRKKLI